MSLFTRDGYYQISNNKKYISNTTAGTSGAVTVLEFILNNNINYKNDMVVTEFCNSAAGYEDIIFETNTTDYSSAGVNDIVVKQNGITASSSTNAFLKYNDTDDLLYFDTQGVINISLKDVVWSDMTSTVISLFKRGQHDLVTTYSNYSYNIVFLPSGSNINIRLEIYIGGTMYTINTLHAKSSLPSDILISYILDPINERYVQVIDNEVTVIEDISGTINNTVKDVSILGMGNNVYNNISFNYGIISYMNIIQDTEYNVSNMQVGDIIDTGVKSDIYIPRTFSVENHFFTARNLEGITYGTYPAISTWKSETSSMLLTSSNSSATVERDGIKLNTGYLQFDNSGSSINKDNFEVSTWYKALTSNGNIIYLSSDCYLYNDSNTKLRIYLNGSYEEIMYSISTTEWLNISLINRDGFFRLMIDGVFKYEKEITIASIPSSVINLIDYSRVSKTTDVYIGQPRINFADIEIGDYTTLSGRNSINAEKYEPWINVEDEDSVLIALSTKRNTEMAIEGTAFQVSLISDALEGTNFVGQDTVSYQPQILANDGLYFDGVDDYLSGTASLPTSVLSIDFWFKINSTPSSGDVILSAGNFNLKFVFSASSQLDVWIGGGSSWLYSGNIPYGTITLSKWNHIILYNNGTNIFFLLNGYTTAKISTPAISILFTEIFIGSDYNETGFYNGSFDNLRITGNNIFNIPPDATVGWEVS